MKCSVCDGAGILYAENGMVIVDTPREKCGGTGSYERPERERPYAIFRGCRCDAAVYIPRSASDGLSPFVAINYVVIVKISHEKAIEIIEWWRKFRRGMRERGHA